MLESAETIRGEIAGSMENTSANLDALRQHDENDENAATVPQLPAPGDKCLVVFRQGGVAIPLQGRGREFENEIRRWLAEAEGLGWRGHDTELLILPAHELRQAIRKAKGAIEAAQFLKYGRA